MNRQSFSRRAFLKVVAAGSAVGLVAACQPAGQSAQTEGSGGPAAAATELRFIKLSMIEPVTAYFEDTAIPAFEDANSNMAVTVDMSDWGHLGEKLLTSFAGNLPVDLVETGSDWIGPYARRKQFMPLDDYIAADYEDEMADFYPDMVAISLFEDKLMGLPYVLDIRTMCYRKDQFAEVGLDPETPPDTWDDLVEFGSKLVQTDDQGNMTRAGYLMDASDPGGAWFEFWYLLIQNGSNFIVPWGSWEPNDVVFNGPEGVEALQFLYDLVHKYKIAPLTGMSSKTPNLSALADGVASMDNNGSWEVGNWKLYQADKLDLLGVGTPLMKKARLQYVCPNVYAIGTNTRDPQSAWDLMKYMESKEVMTDMLEPGNESPPRISIATEAEYMKDPMLTKFQELPAKGWGTTTPQALDSPTMGIIGNYVQAALRDEMGIEEALDAAAVDVKKKVEEFLAAG
ncbi:MAG: extracellular solute-binding protein [Caldilineaceae bacterium]